MVKKISNKLPTVLQTDTQKEFFAATFDQLFSPAEVEQAQGFIGRRSSDVFNPRIDNYLQEPTKLRAAYQLEPIAYAVNTALEDTNEVFYEDFVNYIEFKGGDVGNHDRLFADTFYSFAPPIDVDKYLNYQNYLWLEDGGPIIYIQYAGALGGAEFDSIIESKIIGALQFNTSENEDLRPRGLDLSSGMRVRFEGSSSYDRPLFIEGVGREIRLVEELSTQTGGDSVTTRLFDNSIIAEGAQGTGYSITATALNSMVTPGRDYQAGDVISIWSPNNEGVVTPARITVDTVTAATELTTINGQNQTDYDLGPNDGTFTGGTDYLVGDIITLSDGTEVTVDTVVAGVITEFTITSPSVTSFTTASTLTQVSTNRTGFGAPNPEGTGFTLTTDTNNENPINAIATYTFTAPAMSGDYLFAPNSATGISGVVGSTISGQDETNFNSIGANGTFFGGSGYVNGEQITLSDGTVVTVVNETSGVVDQFTITTESSLAKLKNATLTQTSSTASGTSFNLTLGDANERGTAATFDMTIEGELITVVGGTFTTAATLRPTQVTAAGVIEKVEIVDRGDYIAPLFAPTAPAATTSAGAGTGLQVDFFTPEGDEGELWDNSITNEGFDRTINVNLSRSDYLTVERGSCEGSPWSRTNRWFNVDIVNTAQQLGQIIDATIVAGGINYTVGDQLPVAGDGINGVITVTAVNGSGTITGIRVSSRGQGYTFGGVDQTGAQGTTDTVLWDATDSTPTPSGEAWDVSFDWDEVITSGGGQDAIIDVTLASATDRSTKAERPILEFRRDLQLYEFGNKYLMEVQVVADNELYADVDGQLAGTVVDGVELKDGMRMIFLDPSQIPNFFEWDDDLPTGNPGASFWDTIAWEAEGSAGAVSRFIWEINIGASGVISLVRVDPFTGLANANADPVPEGGVVLATQGDEFAGRSFYQYRSPLSGEYTWREGQLKAGINSHPLYELYDINAIQLADPIQYEGSDFDGNELFSYRILTAADIADTGGTLTADQVLGFPLTLSGLGQISDIVFENDLETDRANYDSGEIPGYYFYREWDADPYCNIRTDIEGNQLSSYKTNWLASPEPERQRVIDRFLADSDTQDTFELSTTPRSNAERFDIRVDEGRRLNTDEFAYVESQGVIKIFEKPIDTGFQIADGTDSLYAFNAITDPAEVYINGFYEERDIDYIVISAVQLSEAAVTPGFGGSGYVVDDELIIIGGTPERTAKVRVVSVDGGGAVTGVFITDVGVYVEPPAGTSVPTSGGTGSGATLDVTFEDATGDTFTIQFVDPADGVTPRIIPADDFIEVREQGSGAPGQDSIVEVIYSTLENVTDDDIGYFEIPNGLENNPNNLEVTENSWSQFAPHMVSIIENQTTYLGTAFGSVNNYRDTLKDGSQGEFILQTQSPLLKAMLASSSTDLDIIEALRFNSKEYARYKNKFVQEAKNLIDQGFTPFNDGDSIPIDQWVDEALRRIIRSREYANAFEDAYMLAFGTVYTEETYDFVSVVTAGTVTRSFNTVSNFVDLTDKKNTMYVYVDEQIQRVDKDYYISNFNPIEITWLNVPSGTFNITIRLYEDMAPAHIPATPQKLGLAPIFLPRVEVDNSYRSPISVLVNHDGSRTPLYGDYRDDLLFEWETRIYNGILEQFRIDYDVPLQEDTHKPGKYRSTRWSEVEWDSLLRPNFFKWVAASRADYITNEFYDVNDPWTWNYSEIVDADGDTLPGYWRGIFDYYYDTQTPHITPWEMLGFAQEPSWWATEYGTAPWASTSPMWTDIEAGVIKGGYRAGTDERYARPGLTTNSLPVDVFGDLLATPLLCIDNSATLIGPTSVQAAKGWVFGDWAPVEYAWRIGEEYSFAVSEALFLARPGEYGEQLWDPEHTFTVPANELQVVSDDNSVYKRVGNNTLYVHGETVGGARVVNTGWQVWVSSRLRALGRDIGNDFGQLVRTLDVKLGHKMASFTNKDTMKIFVEGISVASQANNLLIPQENINVSLHTGAPVREYVYGGVLVRAQADGTFQLFGYDILGGEFNYIPRVESHPRNTNVNVGGQPEPFTIWSAGNAYEIGHIVRFNSIYYRCNTANSDQTFDQSKWSKLSKLPIVGGINVTHKPVGTGSVAQLQYGEELATAQDVFDVIIGYGDWLKEEGWKFEQMNPETGGPETWLSAAKQFLLWTQSNWEAGSIVMISPAATGAVLEVQEGYPAAVEKIVNGVYSILNKEGVAIDPRNTIIKRDNRQIEVIPAIEQVGIYGCRINTTETENIITFDNTTDFNDTIYDPLLGTRLARVNFNGRRTTNWTGKLEAGGYIITEDGLIPNFENMVDSIRFYHDTETILDNPDIENAARHLIGFSERDYYEDLEILNDSQFQFYQGAVRQKGTRQAIRKLERSTKVGDATDDTEIFEEWALKLNEYGNICGNQTVEFFIQANEVKVDPQLVQLVYPSNRDISSNSEFFGPSTISGGALLMPTHGYSTGDLVLFTLDGSAPGGLTNNTIYSVIVVDENTIQLATVDNPTTPISITVPSVSYSYDATIELTGTDDYGYSQFGGYTIVPDPPLIEGANGEITEFIEVTSYDTGGIEFWFQVGGPGTDPLTVMPYELYSSVSLQYSGGTLVLDTADIGNGGDMDHGGSTQPAGGGSWWFPGFAQIWTVADVGQVYTITFNAVDTTSTYALTNANLGTVTSIDIVSNSGQTYVLPPSVTLENHPDDASGQGATATSVLDTDGTLLRIDVINGGYGYILPPTVYIGDTVIDATDDRAVANITFEIDADDATDDVILIDVDDNLRWPTKPTGIACDINNELWPETVERVAYKLPNAGNVSINDTQFSFVSTAGLDALSTLASPPSRKGETINVAYGENEDWAVYILNNMRGQVPNLAIQRQIASDDAIYAEGRVILSTLLSNIVEDSPRRQATLTFSTSGGQVSDVTVTDSGYGYWEDTVITISSASDTSYIGPVDYAVIPVTSDNGQLLLNIPQQTILSQTSADFRNVGEEGTWTAGTGYVNTESITMSDGTTVEVNNSSGGVITEFTITSVSTTDFNQRGTLTQVSSTGSGSGFTLTLGAANVELAAPIGSGYSAHTNTAVSVQDIPGPTGSGRYINNRSEGGTGTLYVNNILYDYEFSGAQTVTGVTPVGRGIGYAVGDELSANGGFTLNSPAVVQVDSIRTIATQDETDFSGASVGFSNGTFEGGLGYDDRRNQFDASIINVATDEITVTGALIQIDTNGSGNVSSVSLAYGGQGYTADGSFTVTDATLTGDDNAVIDYTVSNGRIVTVAISNAGSGYLINQSNVLVDASDAPTMNHGYTTGDSIVIRNGGLLPEIEGEPGDRLLNDVVYYVIVISDTNIQLAYTADDALAGNAINITALSGAAGYHGLSDTIVLEDTSVLTVDDLAYKLIAGQTHANFDNSPSTEGTFQGGQGYAVNDEITLIDGSVIDVDAISTNVQVIAGQTGDNDYGNVDPGDGNFNAGIDYDVGDTITLSDGTVITVTVITTPATGDVGDFEVTSSSTSGSATGATRTQSSTSGAGTGFQLTTGVNNEEPFGDVTQFNIVSAGDYNTDRTIPLTQSSTDGQGSGFSLTTDVDNEDNTDGKVSEFTIASAGSALTTSGSTLRQAQTTSSGVGFELTLGSANEEILDVSIVTGGDYEVLPGIIQSDHTSLAFNSTTDTITATGGTSFIDLGFGVGQTIVIENAENPQNNQEYVIASVTSTVITVANNIPATNAADTEATLETLSTSIVTVNGGTGTGATLSLEEFRPLYDMTKDGVAVEDSTFADNSEFFILTNTRYRNETMRNNFQEQDLLAGQRTVWIDDNGQGVWEVQNVTVPIVAGQNETDYDAGYTAGRGDHGTFFGGSAHDVADVITLSDGSTVTVDAISTTGGVVTEFTVTSASTTKVQFGDTITQVSTTGSGLAFHLHVDSHNLLPQEVLLDDFTDLAFNSTANTITRNGGTDFLTAGFVAGSTFNVSNAENVGNNGSYTISTVTSTVITTVEAITTTNADDESAIITGTSEAFTYTLRETQDTLIDTEKFKQAFVYEESTGDTIVQLPVYDPFKGLIPGAADLNITWTSRRDPARYNNSADETLLSDTRLFDSEQEGLLWWDLSTCAYLYYEQGTDQYRRDNWGKLIDGSSIDIYEWTRSTQSPANYEGDGTVRSTTEYVQVREYDRTLEETRTFYYFWVKDRTVVPEGVERTLAGFEVARLLANPTAQQFQWFSPISQTGFVFAGVEGSFTDSDNIVQINYRRTDEVEPDHVEWQLGREGDPDYEILDVHWNKMVDSLCGFTDLIDIGNFAYTDNIATFESNADVDDGTDVITTDAAHGFSTGDGVFYSQEGGTEEIGLTDGTMYYVNVITETTLSLHADVTDANADNARIDLTGSGAETHSLTQKTTTLNNFRTALPSASDLTKGYLIVPDPALSNTERYGIKTRPLQTMFVNRTQARKIFVEKVNTLMQYVNLRDENPTWNSDMTTNTLWQWSDWYEVGYDATNTVPTFQVDSVSDMDNITQIIDGDFVRVTGTRWRIFEYDEVNDVFNLVAREGSRLELLTTIYTNEENIADATELRELIAALKNNVFILDRFVNSNLVFFAMLNYVFSEQDDLDWAFKTTYVFLKQQGRTLTQERVYQNDPFDAALEYIIESKPYQTKIRDFRTERSAEIDLVPGTAEELVRDFRVDMVYDRIRGGDLSIEEMRVAKNELAQDNRWDGYTTKDGDTTLIRLGAAGRYLGSQDLSDIADIDSDILEAYTTSPTVANITFDVAAGGVVSNATVVSGGEGYYQGGTFIISDASGAGGDNNAVVLFTVDTVNARGAIDSGTISVIVAGTGYTPGAGYTVSLVDMPQTTSVAITTDEIDAVAAINTAITDEFAWDFEGLFLQNTEFTGNPSLISAEISAGGTGYAENDIVTLDAGSGTPIANAIFRVDAVDGGGGITSLQLINGGSYQQTPTIDPVNLNGGTGSGATVTNLLFESGSTVPFDSTPHDQIGWDSSVFDPSVSPLDGTPLELYRTIPGQSHVDFDSGTNEGSFTGGTGYAVLDVITMNDGTDIVVNQVVTGAVTQFTISGGSTTSNISEATLIQSTTTGGGSGFTLTLGAANQSSANFFPVTPEETFSGTGAQTTFTLTTTVPTVFLFVVVDGVELRLNVDYFFIADELYFPTAPAVGTNNIQVYTYIEAGDLINPQVSEGITEEMVPLDPRENLVIRADTYTDYTTGVSLTYTQGTPSTITRGSGSFVSDGISNGDRIYVDGTVSNDGFYIVDTVAALTLTLNAVHNTGAAQELPGGETVSSNIRMFVSFTIHEDTQQGVTYYRNAESASVTTTSNVNIGDDVIAISASAPLDPQPDWDNPALAWIGTELVSYHGIQTVYSIDTLDSIDSGGTGYTTGDVLTIIGNPSNLESNGTITVTSDTGGVIDGAALGLPGTYKENLTNPVSVIGGTIAAQDETAFDNVGTNGSFSGGTGYLIADIGQTITLEDGTVVTIDNVVGDAVTEFTISTTTTGVLSLDGNGTTITLDQDSTTGTGTGFRLVLNTANQTGNNDATFNLTASEIGATLIGARRGFRGTHPQSFVSGQKIFNAQDAQIISNPEIFWHSATATSVYTGSAGQWRFVGVTEDGRSSIHFSDTAANAFNANVVVGETLVVTDADIGYKYLVTDIINIGELGIVDVTTPGTGYEVGDVIDIHSATAMAGTGVTAVVGGVDGNGGIRYVRITARGSGYNDAGAVAVGAGNITSVNGAGAALNAYFDTEGLVCALPNRILDVNGVIAEKNTLTWQTDSTTYSLADANNTTAPSVFLRNEPGKAL